MKMDTTATPADISSDATEESPGGVCRLLPAGAVATGFTLNFTPKASTARRLPWWSMATTNVPTAGGLTP